MGTATLILGESGTGKSASLRDLNPDDCLLIQTIRKPLPFKTDAARTRILIKYFIPDNNMPF